MRNSSRSPSRVLSLLLGLCVVALAACGGGASDGEVASAITDRGGYADPGASLSQGDVEAMSRNVRNAGGFLGVVVLDHEPQGGATAYAETLLNATTVDDVIVVTPQEFGAVSAITSDINSALDAADAGFDNGGDAGLVAAYATERFGTVLSSGDITAGSDGSVESPGKPGSPVVPLAVVGVLGGGAALLVRNGRKKRDAATLDVIEAARDEVRQDLTVMADRILDLDDEVKLADNADMTARYAQASEIYSEARETVEILTDPVQLVELDEDVELARWQLETIEAELRGTTAPPKPAPKPEPLPPPPPQDAVTRPSPQSPRPSSRIPDWAQDEVRGRQRTRRGGGILGDIMGGMVSGASNRSTYRTPSRRSSTRSSSRSSSSRSSGSSRTRSSSSSRAKSRGGRRK